MKVLKGAICWSKIPADCKFTTSKDGATLEWGSIRIIELKEPQTYTDNGNTKTYTHKIEASVKRGDQWENVIVGRLQTIEYGGKPQAQPQSFAPPTPQPQAQPQQQQNLFGEMPEQNVTKLKDIETDLPF